MAQDPVVMRRSPRLFPISVKLVGWWPAAGSVLALGLFFALELLVCQTCGIRDPSFRRRAIETITPLAFSLQAAFLLSADNEPAIELLLACPIPLPRLFRERLFWVAAMHAAITLPAMLVFFFAWRPEGLGLTLLRTLSAALFLCGAAVFSAQVTRQGVYGTLMATTLWAASLYGGDALLKKWKWFWPFHVYLQPEKFGMGTYLLNRLCLAGIGSLLLLLAMKLLKDGDRLLASH